MTLELTSALVALIAMFTIATVLNINVGLVAFAAAFIVGVLISGLDSDDLLSAFPADMFILLVGVTYLFGIARASGAVEWLAYSAFRVAGGRVALVPWIFFGLAMVITVFGGLPGSTIAIVAPLAMACAAQYQINPLMMGLLVIHGTQAGSIAPISPIGIIVNGTVERANLPDVSTAVFLNQAVFVSVLCVIVYFLFGGRELIGRTNPPPADSQDTENAQRIGSGNPGSSDTSSDAGLKTIDLSTVQSDTYRTVTLVGIAAFVVFALGFGFDVGYTAFVVALALTMLRPSISDQAIQLTAWPIVLLICGVLTFVGVMDQIGAIDAVSDGIGNLDNPLVAALSVSYIGAITSLFSTTAGVIGATVPMILPTLTDAGTHQVAGHISAITISSSVVDSSPVSGNGAIVLANLRNRDPKLYFKQLMSWGVLMMVIAPPVAWVVFVVIGIA